MMEAVRTSETSVDNHSTRRYNPEDSSENQNQSTFPLASVPRPALRPTQPPVQWEQGILSWGKARPGRDTDHSLPSSAEVKYEWEL
jgi:hypothetical protein